MNLQRNTILWNNLTYKSFSHWLGSYIFKWENPTYLLKQSTMTSKYLFPKEEDGKGSNTFISILSNGVPMLKIWRREISPSLKRISYMIYTNFLHPICKWSSKTSFESSPKFYLLRNVCQKENRKLLLEFVLHIFEVPLIVKYFSSN